MASREINLIADKHGLSAHAVRMRQVFRRVVPIVLGIFLIASVSVLVLSFDASRKLNDVEKRIVGEREHIGSLSRNEGTYLMLKQKAVALSKILAIRYPYPELWEFLKSLESDSVKIERLSLSDSGMTNMVVKAQDTEAIDTYINRILEGAPERFNFINLENAQLQGGKFSITLVAQSLVAAN